MSSSDSLSTEGVARVVGISRRVCRRIVERGGVGPSVPPRKQGSSAKWSAQDKIALQIVVETTKALRALQFNIEAAAHKLAKEPTGLLVVGPLGAFVTTRRRPLGKLVARLGSPVVAIAGPDRSDDTP